MRGKKRIRVVLVTVLAALGVLGSVCDASAYIYWADSQSDRISRAENDGSGVVDNFIQTGDLPVAVAVDGTFIYWVNENSGSIGRAKLDGSGANNNFITGLVDPNGVAVNGTSIFWSTIPGAIGKAKIDGTSPNPKFIDVASQACGVAVDSGHVYWTDQNGSPSYIGRAGLNGSNVEAHFVTIPGTTFPCGVAVNSSNIFWASFGFFGPDTRLGRANTTTGAGADANFIGDANGPCGVALFGSQLYWANAGTNTIGRANTDGTSVNQVFVDTNGEQVCGVAVDGLATPPAPPPPPPAGSTADTTPPATTLARGPGSKLAQGKAKFTFRSSESGSTFVCKLDKRNARPCKSPKTYTGLKPGRHLFKVWAIDKAGNKDPTPAKKRFRVPA